MAVLFSYFSLLRKMSEQHRDDLASMYCVCARSACIATSRYMRALNDELFIYSNINAIFHCALLMLLLRIIFFHLLFIFSLVSFVRFSLRATHTAEPYV